MGDEKKMPRSPLAAAYSATYTTAVDGAGEPQDAPNGVRSMETITPLGMDAEWDAYVHRKQHSVDLQPIAGVMRNNRTPLNTPYTPQLVKLHLKQHDEYEQQQAEFAERPAKQLVSTIKSRLVAITQPVHRTRAAVDRVATLVLPACLQHSALFQQVRWWAVRYLTAVLCVLFVLLLSPMLIAFSICTSPIWVAGIAVLVVRRLVPVRRHPPLAHECMDGDDASDREEEDPSPHHPNSVYRRAHLTTNHSRRGYR